MMCLDHGLAVTPFQREQIDHTCGPVHEHPYEYGPSRLLHSQSHAFLPAFSILVELQRQGLRQILSEHEKVVPVVEVEFFRRIVRQTATSYMVDCG